jgi:DNA-directed RNA polymerase specialized sigma24 family protein
MAGANRGVSMGPDGSITCWVEAVKAGDRAAVGPLWEAYFRRLVALARVRLHAAPRRVGDEEDVALSAFDSFVRRAGRGEFPRLEDRDDLWQILFVLTVRKALDHARREGRLRRGAGRVRSLEGLADLPVGGSGDDPALAAQMTEEFGRLLDLLGEATLRSVALWKMEGCTNREIAERLGCIEQTVERKLQRIRRLWAREVPP